MKLNLIPTLIAGAISLLARTVSFAEEPLLGNPSDIIARTEFLTTSGSPTAPAAATVNGDDGDLRPGFVTTKNGETQFFVEIPDLIWARKTEAQIRKRQGLDPSITKKPDDANGLTKRDKEINDAVVMGERYATEYLRADFDERAKKFGLSQMQNWYFATDAIMRAAVELYKEDPQLQRIFYETARAYHEQFLSGAIAIPYQKVVNQKNKRKQ